MIRQRIVNPAILLMGILVLSACGEGQVGDYCKNHYEFHAEHKDATGKLSIELDDSGVLKGHLQLPSVTLIDMTPSEIEAVFSNADNTFTLQSDNPCNVSLERVYSSEMGLDAHFSASCGLDNKIGKIDVVLFDHVSGLDEVVTSVTTPATAKRFGISRQCDVPIFRLDKVQP